MVRRVLAAQWGVLGYGLSGGGDDVGLVGTCLRGEGGLEREWDVGIGVDRLGRGLGLGLV